MINYKGYNPVIKKETGKIFSPNKIKLKLFK